MSTSQARWCEPRSLIEEITGMVGAVMVMAFR
jgi:hypothetical protein